MREESQELESSLVEKDEKSFDQNESVPSQISTISQSLSA